MGGTYIDIINISIAYEPLIMIFDYMFNFNNLLGGGTRSGLYGYKLVCFIVSRFDSNRILPFFTLIIVYGIWSYITQDWLRKNNKAELLAPSFMLCLATMPYVYVNTGIRNGLAASLVAWALYQEFEKRDRQLLRYRFYFSHVRFIMRLLSSFLVGCLHILRLR